MPWITVDVGERFVNVWEEDSKLTPVEYRAPTLGDAQELCDLVKEMTDGTAFAPPTLNKVQNLIKRLGTIGYGECAVKDGKIVGFFCGYIGETFLNNQVNAYEQGLYVTPEHRGGSIAIRLIKHFEDWARLRGAHNVWISQSVGQKTDSTLKFFERLGFTCQGFITFKQL